MKDYICEDTKQGSYVVHTGTGKRVHDNPLPKEVADKMEKRMNETEKGGSYGKKVDSGNAHE